MPLILDTVSSVIATNARQSGTGDIGNQQAMAVGLRQQATGKEPPASKARRAGLTPRSLLVGMALTILAFLRPAMANCDLRCIVMPHQMDAMKMAQELDTPRRPLIGAIALSTTLGVVASCMIALTLWHGFGAEAHTDLWRTSQGRVPFDNLVNLLRSPQGPDWPGIAGLASGFAVTTALILLRAQFVWWPLHPVGYAIANTETMTSTWLPFFLAWTVKSLSLRYGGARFYRLARPFFLGLIAGDLFGGGFFTALGAFTGVDVYPVNW